MSKKWVTFFSRTGSEIVEVSKKLHRVPDLIVTNKDLDNDPPCEAFKKFQRKYAVQVHRLSPKPSLDEYQFMLDQYKYIFDDCIITLHGYLRIIPAFLCNKFCILNSHPGDIVNYPFLKGFNPQEKAFNNQLKTSGVVLHEVVPEVDSGRIISLRTTSIEGLALDEVYDKLHIISIQQWCDVLKEYLGETNA